MRIPWICNDEHICVVLISKNILIILLRLLNTDDWGSLPTDTPELYFVSFNQSLCHFRSSIFAGYLLLHASCWLVFPFRCLYVHVVGILWIWIMCISGTDSSKWHNIRLFWIVHMRKNKFFLPYLVKTPIYSALKLICDRFTIVVKILNINAMIFWSMRILVLNKLSSIEVIRNSLAITCVIDTFANILINPL